MTISTNLVLNLFTKMIDADITFEEYRLDLSETEEPSNMMIIDDYFAGVVTLLSLINSNTSGSFSAVSGSLTIASASCVNAQNEITNFDNTFGKIGEFSGSG